MAEWPSDYKTARFNDLVGPIVRAIEFAYVISRQNKGQDIPYDGLPLTSNRILAGCPQISEALKAGQIKYDEEEQGRSALEVLVGKAVQLGIEQGLRMAYKGREAERLYVNYLKEAIEEKPW